MTAPAYRVERADPQLVQEAVVGLWRGNLGGGVDLYKKYRWLYGEEASQPGDIYLLYVSSQDAPVGAYGLVPRNFRAADRIVRGAILSDLVVDSKHRTLFPGMLLQKTVVEDGGHRYELIYGFPNSNAKPLFRRLGYRPLGHMVRYTRLVDATKKVKERLHPLLGAVISPVVNLALRMEIALKTRQSKHRVAFSWNETGVNQWPLSTIRTAAVQGSRDAQFLHHRFARNPRGHFDLLGLLGNNNSVEGYAVVQTKLGVLSIVDLYVESQNLTATLLELISEARGRGAEAIHVELLDTPAVSNAVKAAGFLAREAREVYYFTATDSPFRRMLDDGIGWYLTAADEDQ